jgi:quercetin dioxygenase-like cupin family protein
MTGNRVSASAMEIFRSEDRPSERGRPDYFSGVVWLDAIGGAPSPGRVRALRVSFEPGARTAWHAHPFGQVLHILAGVGRVQRAGEPAQTVRAGDTVVIPAGERHWHGAAPRHAMVHIAMQEADEQGVHATWFEHVTDADYGAT